MMFSLTIKMRLTLWYMIILSLILTAFSSFIYINVENYMYKQVELKLKNEAEQLIGEFENSDNGKEKLDTNTLVAEVKEYEDEENLLAYYNADKELILSNRANYVFVDKLNFDGRNLENNYKVIEVENENHDGDWAVLTLPIYTDNRNFLGWIKLGNPLESETEILDKLLVIFILGIPLFLITAVIGGYFLAWKALSPIDKITRTARDISSNNLEKRIEEKNMDDEVGRLITTLNQLFSRLEKAFKREKQFTADASHELRTPITVIRAQSEKTLREKDDDINIHTLYRASKAVFLNNQYYNAPMTPDFWNSKVHNLGFEKPGSSSNLRFRHHAHFWETKFITKKGMKIYVGTASFDSGIKWGVTHRIDPYIDREREYLFKDLQSTSLIKLKDKYQIVEPNIGSDFAGNLFLTDGQVYVIIVN